MDANVLKDMELSDSFALIFQCNSAYGKNWRVMAVFFWQSCNEVFSTLATESAELAHGSTVEPRMEWNGIPELHFLQQ